MQCEMDGNPSKSLSSKSLVLLSKKDKQYLLRVRDAFPFCSSVLLVLFPSSASSSIFHILSVYSFLMRWAATDMKGGDMGSRSVVAVFFVGGSLLVSCWLSMTVNAQKNRRDVSGD